MVTDGKVHNAALIRYRLGNALILLGVLTWLPFIVLRIAGEKPALLWYLPFHLLGVVGGSHLRSISRREMGALSPKKSRLWVIGHVLIFLGVLVWAPYFYLKVFSRASVELMNFLPYHLIGVLGGIGVLAINYFISRRDV